jgi:hypothetical protein
MARGVTHRMPISDATWDRVAPRFLLVRFTDGCGASFAVASSLAEVGEVNRYLKA